MNITLNVDEKLFDEGGIGEAIKDAFTNMPMEEKSSVMKEFLKQYLLDSGFIKRYFVEDKRLSSWGTYQTEEAPTAEFRKLISTIDFSEEMDDVKKIFEEVIKNDLKEQVIKLMVDSYVNTIANTLFDSSSEFRVRLSQNIFSIVINQMNNMNKT